MFKFWLRLLMGIAIFSLICGSTTVDLLDRNAGFMLRSWRPGIPAYKGGGVYQNSPLADGQRLVHAQRENWLETFDLEARDSSADAAIRTTQELRRLLENAARYWSNSDPTVQPSIPYIKAQASYETNPRYAVIVQGQMAEDENPFAQPFLQPDCRSAASGLTLVLEHGPWLADIPGTGTCVQASALAPGLLAQTTVTAAPAQSSDDGFNHTAQTDMNVVQDHIFMGWDTSEAVDGFIRFTNLNIPAGATILRAYVTFVADASIGIADCRLRIYAEQTDDAATWSTYQDYAYRRRVSRNYLHVNWPWIDDGVTSIEPWVLGNSYSTPDLSILIQEIVNRPGWVANNDLALFFANNGSSIGAYRAGASWDHVTYTEPILTVIYTTGAGTYGQATTCLREVYTANHHTRAQLTHIYWNSGAAWSGNLLGAARPYALLDNPIADNDVVYFGCNTALVNSGPFSSLVFDLTTAAVYTGTARLDWQYWNGAWAPLTVRDNTNTGMAGGALSAAGVNSVHWVQPANWVPTAINGVTAYWVRALVDYPAGGDLITTPAQGNRDVYTITTPYLDIAANQVGGDLPAYLREIAENESDYVMLPPLAASRTLVGLRAVDRGADFSAYINLCQEQNAAGITITAAGPTTTFDVDTLAPTGISAHWNPAGAAAMSIRATVLFTAAMAAQYKGTFHAFLRGRQVAGAAGDIQVRLRTFNGATLYTSGAAGFSVIAVPQALDLGRVRLPGFEVDAADPPGYLLIFIEASATSGTPELYMYDLILFPVDEWAADLATVVTQPTSAYSVNGYDNYLDIDSIRYPRLPLAASLRAANLVLFPGATADAKYNEWRVISTGPAILQSGKAQRLWHFSFQTTYTTFYVQADHEIAFRHRLWATQRYFSMRGNR